jgi:amino acid transporter
MFAPTSWKDWIVLAGIIASGIVAFVWMMPWAVQHPLVTPLEAYRASNPRTYAAVMNLTPVFVGVTIVAVCAVLWAFGMNWRMSRPVVLQQPRDHR